MKLTNSQINHALRLAQDALWNLEVLGIMNQSEILKITGILQGLKKLE